MSRVLIISILAGIAGMILAGKKGRSTILWFILSFLFPLSILVLLVLPPALPYAGIRQCNNCGRPLTSNETVCPSCNNASPINMVTCPSCGVIVREQGNCDNCGKPLR
ncbi:MAG: hypothetical protein JSV21_03255 [Nitrospirota bacterium]|nr:MAG: hypothetical protein JSV21_03255 [Nitrospirota bacterium]